MPSSCPTCGYPVEAAHNYCMRCGTTLEAAQPAATARKQPQDPTVVTPVRRPPMRTEKPAQPAATAPSPHVQHLYQALLSAFPTEDDLRQMVRFGLEEDLESIAGSGPLRTVVFKLVQWAEARGRLATLLTAALKANPENPALRALDAAQVFAEGSAIDSPPSDKPPRFRCSMTLTLALLGFLMIGGLPALMMRQVSMAQQSARATVAIGTQIASALATHQGRTHEATLTAISQSNTNVAALRTAAAYATQDMQATQVASLSYATAVAMATQTAHAAQAAASTVPILPRETVEAVAAQTAYANQTAIAEFIVQATQSAVAANQTAIAQATSVVAPTAIAQATLPIPGTQESVLTDTPTPTETPTNTPTDTPTNMPADTPTDGNLSPTPTIAPVPDHTPTPPEPPPPS